MKNLDIAKLEVLDAAGDRNFVIPAEVNGPYRTRRMRFYFFLMLVFLLVPWIKINGQQLMLLDIPARKFYILGFNFAAHDTPLIFLFLIIATISLALVTAVWGRVWCGWACPQTVFIELIYRQIERLTEGNYLARRRLRSQAMGLDKFLRLVAKWTLYLLVSSIFAHSFAAYFVNRDLLIEMILAGPSANITYFVLICGFTSLLLFNFGWFREQFCLIACPYGRIQSILMDTQSMSVVYDSKRGEPRKGTTRGNQPNGDCVSCFKCVAVCPTGIDIRNGQQMECIACTACMDACDEIMVKMGKKPGLISYNNLSGKKIQLFRGRPLAYLFIILLAATGLGFALTQRHSFDVTILRAIESPYQIVKDASGNDEIINHFRLRIKNQWNQAINIKLESASPHIQMIIPQHDLDLKPLELRTVHFFTKAESSSEAKSIAFLKVISEQEGNHTETIELPLLKPESN